MTETTPPSLISNEDIRLVRDKFTNQQIFKDIAELVANDEAVKQELNTQIIAHLQRLIMSNLKSSFKSVDREKALPEFILELTQLKSGEEQVQMIDGVLGGADQLFWESIETQLHDDLLMDLLGKLRETQ